MQAGGEQSQAQQMPLSQQIAQVLQSGVDPRTLANELLSSGVDEADIREAFMELGLSSSDIDELFKSEEEIQAETDESLAEAEEMAQQEQMAQAQSDEGEDSDVDFGAFGNDMMEAQFGVETPFLPNINQYFGGIARQKGDDYVKNPMANYLPMDLGTKGSVAGAGFLLAEGLTDLFGGKTNKATGLKEGFFRDADIKKARQKAAIPSYYDYKVTTAAGDDKEYVTDKLDLYNAAKNQGSLRTKEQYAKDVMANSQVDFNTKDGVYEGIFSSRAIDRNLLGEDQKKELDKFLEKSTSVQALNDRFDPETIKMLKGSINEGMGSLGISPGGVASSYKDAETNPYLYETMMGRNTLQSKEPEVPVINGLGPAISAPAGKYDWYNPGMVPKFELQEKQMGGQYSFFPVMAYGGDILFAQKGLENNPSILSNSSNMLNPGPLSFQEWVLEDPVRRGTATAPQEYEAYLQQFNSVPTNNVGPTASAPAATTGTVPAAPKVEITNQFAGDLNRFMDSRAMQGFGKVSNFAVNAADFTNEMFKNKKAKEAEARLYSMTQADNAFGYFEDPVNKQGTWDVNTGLAEQDNRVEYMRAQQGGEMGEIELDPDTIAKLIAAGANIQIL